MLKKLSVIFFSLFILSTACSRGGSDSALTATAAPFYSQDEISTESIDVFDENAHTFRQTTIRKLVINSNIRIRTEILDSGVDRLNELMEIYGSYASSVNVYENSRYYTLRVPAQRYGNFLEEIKEMGNVLSFNETTEDVTLRYYDLESRLNTKRELISTFQNYLNRANSIEEILSIETRIAELQREIDDVGRQFLLLNNQIDYSTINLELLGPISASNYGRETMGERMKNLVIGFGNYISTIFIILIGIIIYGLPILLIVLILYCLFFGKIGILKKIFRFVSGSNTEKKN